MYEEKIRTMGCMTTLVTEFVRHVQGKHKIPDLSPAEGWSFSFISGLYSDLKFVDFLQR